MVAQYNTHNENYFHTPDSIPTDRFFQFIKEFNVRSFSIDEHEVTLNLNKYALVELIDLSLNALAETQRILKENELFEKYPTLNVMHEKLQIMIALHNQLT